MALQTDKRWRYWEINGGSVNRNESWFLQLPPVAHGYANAQVDDDGQQSGRAYLWRPGVVLTVRARFSHAADTLLGTAGFGFWNAPFGNPTVRWPALPQAAWFFFASAPTNLPVSIQEPGRGWFVGTVDAATPRAWVMAPAGPLVLLLNRRPRWRQRLWPTVQRRLGISFAPLMAEMTHWHDYRLVWQVQGCQFYVDGELVLQTPCSPRGPLGFVCWLDNQYLVLTPNGRLAWGTLVTQQTQWVEITQLALTGS